MLLWPNVCLSLLGLTLVSSYRINYALGKPTHQSSTYRTATSLYAVDGNTKTSSNTQQEEFPFLVVDLQKPIWVTAIALTNRNNYYYRRMNKFTIMVGVNTDWKKNQHCHSYLETVPNGATMEFPCDNLLQGHVVSVNKTSSGEDRSMWMLAIQELQVFGVEPGMTYRLSGGKKCSKDLMNYWESRSLQDGDMTTCEVLSGGMDDYFGVFLKESRRRLIDVNVYGPNIPCSPVGGVSLVIVSANGQRHPCKAYYSTASDLCKYSCQCPKHDLCSHIIIMVSPMLGEDRLIRICEINTW